MSCVWPLTETDGEAGVIVREVNDAATPVPLRLMTCGLLLALSVIVIPPVLMPTAVGVKVTLIVQLPLEATDGPHVFVWPKSPVATMLVTVRPVT